MTATYAAVFFLPYGDTSFYYRSDFRRTHRVALPGAIILSAKALKR